MTKKKIISQWKEFYRYCLNQEVDFSDLHLPLFLWSFRHYILVPEGFTCQFLFEEHANLFSDAYALKNYCTVLKNERDSHNVYFIGITRNEEKDNPLLEKSADEIQKMGMKTLTLLECLLWLLQYHYQWRKYPTKNYILCCGTRDTYGFLPRVSCNDKSLKIEFVGTHVKGSLLHARRVFVP